MLAETWGNLPPDQLAGKAQPSSLAQPAGHQTVLTSRQSFTTGLVAPDIPDRPSSNDGSPRTEWKLTLADAIELTLQQNRDLLVERFESPKSSWNVDSQDSIFDPVLSLGGEWSRSEEQVTNIADGPGTGVSSAATDYFNGPQGLGDQLKLSKQLRTGGTVKADFSSSYRFSEPGGDLLALNPAIRSNLSLQVNHNLWQGVGRDVNMVNVQIAHHVHSNAHRMLETQMRKKVLATASAYWGLLGTRERLSAQQKAIDESYAVWQQEIEKKKLGSSSGPDVAEAREQLERFKVFFLQAEQEAADAERALRDLLGVPLEDAHFVQPVSQPTQHPPTLEWESAVLAAMGSRPEIQVQQTELRMAQLKRLEAADRLKPNLSGYAGWGLSGAAEKFGDSIETIHDGDYAQWWLGFQYEHRFGRRRDRAIFEQAQLNVQQNAAKVEQSTRMVQRELHDAYQSVENAWRIVEATRERLAAADSVLDARKEMYDLGEIRLEDKLRALNAWGQASSAERSAIADYNNALTEWEYAKGSILEYARIRFQPKADTLPGG